MCPCAGNNVQKNDNKDGPREKSPSEQLSVKNTRPHPQCSRGSQTLSSDPELNTKPAHSHTHTPITHSQAANNICLDNTLRAQAATRLSGRCWYPPAHSVKVSGERQKHGQAQQGQAHSGTDWCSAAEDPVGRGPVQSSSAAQASSCC
ncbi:uncharacterized protein V6R79_018590 [Siganus canaliculatus]